jgi:hypothetical protein
MRMRISDICTRGTPMAAVGRIVPAKVEIPDEPNQRRGWRENMSRVTVRTILFSFAFIFLLGVIAFASRPISGNVPVTTYLSDFNAAGVAYSVFSDGGGAYEDGVSGVGSYLVQNGYNHIEWGDWRLDLTNSTSRQLAVTFSTANAVQPGDPGYTAPANPPYWGTKYWYIHMENKCSMNSLDMLTMLPGSKFNCITILRFPTPSGSKSKSSFYKLDMGNFSGTEPEAQEVQVSCNSSDSGGCNDWFIDPIPVVNADGSTSPGQTRARLVLVSGNLTTLADEGDFYLTFHIHVTRP